MRYRAKLLKIVQNAGFILCSTLSFGIIGVAIFGIIVNSISLFKNNEILEQSRKATCLLTSCYVYDIDRCYVDQTCLKYNFTFVLSINGINYTSFQSREYLSQISICQKYQPVYPQIMCSYNIKNISQSLSLDLIQDNTQALALLLEFSSLTFVVVLAFLIGLLFYCCITVEEEEVEIGRIEKRYGT